MVHYYQDDSWWTGFKKLKARVLVLVEVPRNIASILIPKTLANRNLRIQEVEKEDVDPDDAIRDIGKVIAKETKQKDVQHKHRFRNC